ncbi:bacteriocin [Aquimarina sp. RZ0]|uniref:bacteriocin n=1 Tax=Aquimarina sp. RZ0 TaxID=2607730 RepID=UPI0011F0E2B7|nr:bacteriocin [Aquimarina sp. RZ0]KAA1247150.1 bacteriocin [Aquimarina sp. RZ0]
MLHKILSLKGTKRLNKNQLKNVTGGSTSFPLPDCSAVCHGVIQLNPLTGSCFCVID